MKKIMMTLMVAVAAMIAMPAVAQQPQTTLQCNKECTKECKGEKKGDRKGHKKGRKGDRKGPQCCKGDRKASQGPAFRGVELNAAQQAQVDTIFSQAGKMCKAECDKARQTMNATIDQRVKEVLTPDQFAVYQANKEQMKGRKADNKDRQPGDRKAGDHKDKKRK